LYSHKEKNQKRIQPEKPSLTQDSVLVLRADSIKTERTTIRENGKETMSRQTSKEQEKKGLLFTISFLGCRLSKAGDTHAQASDTASKFVFRDHARKISIYPHEAREPACIFKYVSGRS
jgi:hypothetical protein